MLKEYINTLQNKYNHCIKMTSFERIYLGIYKTENNFDSSFRKQARFETLKRRSFRFSNFLKFRAIYKVGIDNNIPFIELWKNNCDYAFIRLYQTGNFVIWNENFSSNDIRFINIFLDRLGFKKVDKQYLLNNNIIKIL